MNADERYMHRALDLAERGWGHVAPNPLVGAVVVADGAVVGEGHHERFGEEHAEVIALRQAGSLAAGATLYVNLEPCAHRGKTPPCDEAIRRAGVREVVIACRDPNVAAAGGVERLESAGVRVRLGPGADDARRLNAPFFWRVTQELPFVALKLAVSLDGRIAAAPGVRTAVTGTRAREEVHRLRAGYDAVLVGSGTAAADDPKLTVREGPPPRVPPVRVVVDTRLMLSQESDLVRSIGEAPVWVLAADEADGERRAVLEGAGVRVLGVASSRRRIDLEAGLNALKEAGIGTVLVEGGARLASSLIRGGLVHRLYLLIAPVIFGERGLPAFADLPASGPEEWEISDRRDVGRDTLIVLENLPALARLVSSTPV
jgi:diaminohydroxyphosphoribosylaminopyrimidine deaminase/5-amino-6-(5-phosphoribosylamino)uracil reductase